MSKQDYSSMTQEQLRAAAREWMDTPIRCPRRCPDCHGSGCGFTYSDSPGGMSPPRELSPYVAALDEEAEAAFQTSLAKIEEENRLRRDALNWLDEHGEAEPPAELAEEVRIQRRIQADNLLRAKAAEWVKEHSVNDEVPEELAGAVICIKNGIHRWYRAAEWYELPLYKQ